MPEEECISRSNLDASRKESEQNLMKEKLKEIVFNFKTSLVFSLGDGLFLSDAICAQSKIAELSIYEIERIRKAIDVIETEEDLAKIKCLLDGLSLKSEVYIQTLLNAPKMKKEEIQKVLDKFEKAFPSLKVDYI